MPGLTATVLRCEWRGAGAPYLFLAPAIVLFVALLAAPIGYTIYLSFRSSKVSGLGLGAGSRQEVWAGLDNFRAALSDSEFVSSVGRVLLYGAILVPTMMGLALVFALLLDSKRSKAWGFSRTAIFLPYAVPAVIASLLWGFLYLPDVSPFGKTLEARFEGRACESCSPHHWPTADRHKSSVAAPSSSVPAGGWSIDRRGWPIR